MTSLSSKKTILVVFTLILTIFSFSYANTSTASLNVNRSSAIKNVVASGDYSFKVHNNTKVTITKILVSEDGKDYGYFDIGNGIAPGETAELVWDKSTNGESCHQYFKAMQKKLTAWTFKSYKYEINYLIEDIV